MTKNHVRAKALTLELRQAGMTRYGLLRGEVAQLPKVIAEGEHIKGCIYGHYEGGSALLVATNKRLIFLDKKPLNFLTEEIAFDQITDISADWQPFYSRVTIVTRAGSYVMRYVNTKCARIMVSYLEKVVLGVGETEQVDNSSLKKTPVRIKALSRLSLEESQMLNSHFYGVLSTYGDDGYPYGATIYYFPDSIEPNIIRFVTKSTTPTAAHVRLRKKVGLTITDIERVATMHISGEAILEENLEAAYEAIEKLMVHNPHIPSGMLPPIAQIKNGLYLVYAIRIARSYMHAYRH